MANYINHKSTLYSRFFKPLFDAFPDAAHSRKCQAIPDQVWIECGVRRCLEFFKSGRHFLQYASDTLGLDIRMQTFFESLKSHRRLDWLSEVLLRQTKSMNQSMPDRLVSFPCLKDFDIYASDGHSIKAACHDRRLPTSKRATSKSATSPSRLTDAKQPTTHIYCLNLRSHSMAHLCVADHIKRSKEHEMSALKRQDINSLRLHAPSGRKVLHVYDRAAIGHHQWYRWKNQGLYMLSREKENMALMTVGDLKFDKNDPLNQGVIANHLVGPANGVAIRRIIFRDPETGQEFSFMTNLPDYIPPGVVAMLYKMRWDVEKVFDQFKNKLEETKAWATSSTAKVAQARLLCLTHNLLTVMEHELEQEGVRNEAEYRRKAKVLEKRAKDYRREKGGELPTLYKLFVRCTQRSVKFIRWLNHHLDSSASWERSLARLQAVYASS